MESRRLCSLGCLASMILLGSGLVGCQQIRQVVERLRPATPSAPSRDSAPAGQMSRIPYLYTGHSRKGTSQDVKACAANARSILVSNGYVDSANESRNQEGSALWVSGDRNDPGVSAEFQCSSNGVTVLAMAGLDNDKVFSEYNRIHDLNW